MARRNSPRPENGKLNLFGKRLRHLREKEGLSAVAVIGRLQRMGWDIGPEIYSIIETGQRSLTDFELTLILKALKRRLRDLE